MKVKTSTLTYAALNWAVSVANKNEDYFDLSKTYCDPDGRLYLCTKGGFSVEYTDWDQGGPIIDRERIATQFWVSEGEWEALIKGGFFASRGPTPLIAAMRCYVASKLGDEVEIPDELLKTP